MTFLVRREEASNFVGCRPDFRVFDAFDLHCLFHFEQGVVGVDRNWIPRSSKVNLAGNLALKGDDAVYSADFPAPSDCVAGENLYLFPPSDPNPAPSFSDAHALQV